MKDWKILKAIEEKEANEAYEAFVSSGLTVEEEIKQNRIKKIKKEREDFKKNIENSINFSKNFVGYEYEPILNINENMLDWRIKAERF